MSIDLDAIKRRYTETVSVTDAFGRAIKVGRLKMSQIARASEMAGNESVMLIIRAVCSVHAIDDKDFAFPENRAIVNSRLDLLGEEGVDAVAEAYKMLFPPADASDEEKAPASVGELGKA